MADRDRIPDWLLERVLLDELPSNRRDPILARVAADPTAQQRLAELRQSDQEILDSLPPEAVAREVVGRARVAAAAAAEQPTARRSWTFAGAGLAAAAAVAVLALVALPVEPTPDGRPIVRDDSPDDPTRRTSGPDDPIRLKGDPRLILHRKRGDAVDPVTQRTTARAGDRIQIAYQPAGHTHGVVLSIDGRGVVTLHYPDDPRGDTALRLPGPVRLAHSYELDDAPGFERFFFITSGRPLMVSAIIDQANDLARSLERASGDSFELPDHVKQWSFLLRKEPKR